MNVDKELQGQQGNYKLGSFSVIEAEFVYPGLPLQLFG